MSLHLASELAVLVGTLVAQNVVAVLVLLAALRLAGLRPASARLFTGPVVFVTRLLDTPLTVGAIPFSSSVDVPGASPFEAEGPRAPGFPRQFWQLPRYQQVLVVLVFPLALSAIAALLLGPSRAATELYHGPAQLIAGAASPLTVGAPLIAAWGDVLREQGVARAVGVLVAKLAVLELLPVGSAGSFRAAVSALGLVRERWTASVSFVLMLAGLAVMAAWSVALVAHAAR